MSSASGQVSDVIMKDIAKSRASSSAQVSEATATVGTVQPAYLARREALLEAKRSRDYQQYWCVGCKEWLIGFAFELHVRTGMDMKRVCSECKHLGYSLSDCEPYICSGGHRCGHLFFDSQHLRDWRRGHGSTLTCLGCAALYKCDACCGRRSRSDFDSNVFAHAQKDGRALVCKDCTKKGYSAKDTGHYMCKNGHQCGHLEFNPQVLQNMKRRPFFRALCKHCQRDGKPPREKPKWATHLTDEEFDDMESRWAQHLMDDLNWTTEPVGVTDREILRDEVVLSMPQARDVENHDSLKEYTCDRCALEHTRSDAQTDFDSTRSEGKMHVCLDCRACGYAPNDIRDYICPICRCRRGYLYFDGTDALKARLKHGKGRYLECEEACSVCRQLKEQQVKKFKAEQR
jgi:hypothetical protein